MNKVNFSEVFGEIYSKHGTEIENLRKKVLIEKILIIIVTIFLIYFIYHTKLAYDLGEITAFIIMFIIIGALLLIKYVNKDYIVAFKLLAIRKMIESQDSSYKYSPKIGVTSVEYNQSDFDRTWDKFYSEDGIQGNLNSMVGFKMSQVRTQEIHRDSKGRSSTVTTFEGLYGIIVLPERINGRLDIMGESKFRKFSKNRINLDSAEFEKYYDVMSNNKIWALQVLNSEALEGLIGMRTFFKKPISIRIVENKIYFRLYCGDIFEPATLKNTINFDILYKYYRLMDIPRNIYEILIDNMASISDNKEFKDSIKYEKHPELLQQEKDKQRKTEEENNENAWFSNKR